MSSPSGVGIAYGASLLAFAVIDGAWLALVAAELFKAQLGAILRSAPLLPAVLAFYCVYAAGIVALAVSPALAQGSARMAMINGGMLGLTAYATFDLTCLAIIEGWTWRLALIDIAWGAALTAFAALAGYHAGRAGRGRA